MGEEPTLAQIEQMLAEDYGKAEGGFYIAGHLLEEKVYRRRGGLEHVLGILDMLKSGISTKTFETRHEIKQEKDGQHHQITVKARGMGGTIVHEVAINYFVMNNATEAEAAEREELQELLDKNDPMVFENKRAKHGILDARIIDRYEIAGGLGAMFGYFISFGSRDYAQLMGVRFAEIAKKIFREKD